MRIRPLASFVMVLGCLQAFTVLAGAQEPLTAFPEDTGAVLRIASIDKLTGGFKEMIGGLGPVAAIVGPQIEVGLAQALQLGTTVEGVDRAAPAFVAVFPMEGQSAEPVAWMVKASDENKLRRAVVKATADEALAAESVAGGFEKIVSKGTGTWFFGRHGELVLYTRSSDVHQLLVSCRGAEKTFATLVEPRAAQLLEAGDAAVLVNAAHLTKLYGKPLELAREQAVRQIEGLSDDSLGGGGANAQAARRLYLQLANLAFDAVADARWAAGRLNFNASGVSAAAVLAVKEGSASDLLFASSPPTNFENLGLLPAGAAAYYGYFSKAPALARNYIQSADEEIAKRLEAARDEASQAGAGPTVGSFALPADARSGTIAITLQQAEKPDALRASNRKFQAAVGEVKTPIFTQSTEYQEAAESYHDRPVDILTTKFELAKTDDQGLQIAQQFLQQLFGGESLQTRVTTLEGLLVQSSGNDPKYIHEVVDRLGTGEGVLGLSEAYAKSRDQLADEANLVVMLNLPQLIVEVVKLLRGVPAIAPFLTQVPFNFGVQPEVSFAGFSAGTERQGVGLHVFVPIAQPKGVLQIFGQGL